MYLIFLLNSYEFTVVFYYQVASSLCCLLKRQKATSSITAHIQCFIKLSCVICVCVQLMRDQLQQEEQRERQQQLQLQQNAAQQYMQYRMARPHAPTPAISTPQHYQNMQVPVEVLKVSRATTIHQTMSLFFLGWLVQQQIY